jgi:uncharacterized protein YcbK (DUF882 family)
MSQSANLSRRRFIGMALTGLACVAAKPAFALSGRTPAIKELTFHNLHTDERATIAYWRSGFYDRAGFLKINHILRDFRTGDEYPMHAGLMDLLHNIQTNLGHEGAIEVISGYRSPHTNAMLVSHSEGVANHSYHMRGMAIDIRLPGTPLAKLHNVALDLKRGGVGYYPSSDFVHVDVGPVRRWG